MCLISEREWVKNGDIKYDMCVREMVVWVPSAKKGEVDKDCNREWN